MIDDLLFESNLLDLKNIRPTPKPKVKILKVPFSSVCERCGGTTTPRLFTRKLCDTCRQRQPKKPHVPKTRIVECLRCKIPLTLVGQGASKKLCPTCKELSKIAAKAADTEKIRNNPAYREKLYAKNNAREESKRRARGDMTMAEWTELQRSLSNPLKAITRRIDRNISRAMRYALKKDKSGWRSSVGWTMPELKVHLEKHFRFGMSWDNYGKWHIDHIKPRSLFSYTSPHDPEFKECWSLGNLQPLWAGENISKGNTYPCPYHDNVMVILS